MESIRTYWEVWGCCCWTHRCFLCPTCQRCSPSTSPSCPCGWFSCGDVSDVDSSWARGHRCKWCGDLQDTKWQTINILSNSDRSMGIILWSLTVNFLRTPGVKILTIRWKLRRIWKILTTTVLQNKWNTTRGSNSFSFQFTVEDSHMAITSAAEQGYKHYSSLSKQTFALKKK